MVALNNKLSLDDESCVVEESMWDEQSVKSQASIKSQVSMKSTKSTRSFKSLLQSVMGDKTVKSSNTKSSLSQIEGDNEDQWSVTMETRDEAEEAVEIVPNQSTTMKTNVPVLPARKYSRLTAMPRRDVTAESRSKDEDEIDESTDDGSSSSSKESVRLFRMFGGIRDASFGSGIRMHRMPVDDAENQSEMLYKVEEENPQDDVTTEEDEAKGNASVDQRKTNTMVTNEEQGLLETEKGDSVAEQGVLLLKVKDEGNMSVKDEGLLLAKAEGDLLEKKEDGSLEKEDVLLLEKKEAGLLEKEDDVLLEKKEAGSLDKNEDVLLEKKEGDLLEKNANDLTESDEGILLEEKECASMEKKEENVLMVETPSSTELIEAEDTAANDTAEPLDVIFNDKESECGALEQHAPETPEKQQMNLALLNRFVEATDSDDTPKLEKVECKSNVKDTRITHKKSLSSEVFDNLSNINSQESSKPAKKKGSSMRTKIERSAAKKKKTAYKKETNSDTSSVFGVGHGGKEIIAEELSEAETESSETVMMNSLWSELCCLFTLVEDVAKNTCIQMETAAKDVFVRADKITEDNTNSIAAPKECPDFIDEGETSQKVDINNSTPCRNKNKKNKIKTAKADGLQ